MFISSKVGCHEVGLWFHIEGIDNGALNKKHDIKEKFFAVITNMKKADWLGSTGLSISFSVCIYQPSYDNGTYSSHGGSCLHPYYNRKHH